MKSADEVLLLLAQLDPLARTETVERERALGRVLAEEPLATVDVPGVDVSAMDGYAWAGAPDLANEAPVVATIAAGDPPGRTLDPGQVARIMTGAPIPNGADRVVPVELTDGGVQAVRTQRGVEAGAHIRHRAEIVSSGQPLLGPGTVLRPSTLAWLATHGIPSLTVFERPRVAFATTGDEVVPPDQIPRPGQLRDSHSDFLESSLLQLGICPVRLGILPDRRETLDQAIERGLEHDVLILCGGVSAGAYDFVEPALLDAGCTIRVDAVAIQPGKPLVVAEGPHGQRIFGLPGNPASVFVTFTLFVRPTLERLGGLPARAAIEVTLGQATPRAAPERDRYVPVQLRADGLAAPLGSRGSHDLTPFSLADGLVRVPRGSRLEAGSRVALIAW